MSESDYTVVSNISRYGMAPVEAGAYIADVIQDLLAKGRKVKTNKKGLLSAVDNRSFLVSVSGGCGTL